MPTLAPGDWLLLVVALAAATLNGGLGYGFSSVTVPAGLLVHTSRVLNPGLVLVEVLLNTLAVIANRRAIPRVFRRVLPMLIGGVPGVALGSWALASVDAGYLKLGTYAVLLPLIVLQSAGARWPVRSEAGWGIPLGAGVGVLYSATTISGPPLALLFNNQGLNPQEFRAALSLFRLFESTLTALAYLLLGFYTAESLALSAQLAPAVAIGIPLGYWLLRGLEPETFRRICMGSDAVLVSFGLSRVATSLFGLPPSIAYGFIGLVLLGEVWLVRSYFIQRAAVRALSVPVRAPAGVQPEVVPVKVAS